MDLYSEKEHVISSDEYTDEDDDDALMNDAVRAQDYNFQLSSYSDRAVQHHQKQKELSSLIRRNKISVIYKNKSIKWLNGKKQRERYKELIYLNAKKSDIDQIETSSITALDRDEEESKNEKVRDVKCDLTKEVVSVKDDETKFSNKSNNKENMEENEVLQGVPPYKCSPEVMYIQQEKGSASVDKKNTIMEKHKIELLEEIKNKSEKRRRSTSPSTLNEDNDVEVKGNEKKIRMESPQFYKSINDMFPKFDKIVTEHIDTVASSNSTAATEKMKCLSNEIDTLNEILRTKEMEWNRLLHLKMVKQEIYFRLSQKHQLLQMKDHYAKQQGENSLLELKEFEMYLSDKHKLNSSETSHQPPLTIQKLIENRANMKTEDLEREKKNTSRLHSLLVSRHMLHGHDSLENTSSVSNGEKTGIGTIDKNSEFYKHTDVGNIIPNKGRQGDFRDVKSIIADFRQRNPELPRISKRIESNPHYQSFSIPFFEKTTTGQKCFIKDQPAEFYTSPSLDVSTASNGAKKLPSSHDIDLFNTVNNHYNIRLEEKYLKNQMKGGDFEGKCLQNVQYPLCQECKSKESHFVCAGCGNQWYCSKKCQISAWDKHSELCTE